MNAASQAASDVAEYCRNAAGQFNESADDPSDTSSSSPAIDPTDVAGKTPQEIDQLAKDNGLTPKEPDPMSGRGAYTDPVTGEQRILCHTNCDDPHAHVNNSQGQRLDISSRSSRALAWRSAGSQRG